MPVIDAESELVARAKSGDYNAFESLVDSHERRLYWIVKRIVGQQQDAEDIVQATFLSALEHLGSFRQASSFKTWITRIATNKALNLLAKRKGLPSISLDAAIAEDETGTIPHPEYIADWKEKPSALVERSELRRILDEAVDSLPEKYRLVFTLRDVEGMSVRDTAEMLGITEANVRVRLLRARLALREKLTRTFGDQTVRIPSGHGSAVVAEKD